MQLEHNLLLYVDILECLRRNQPVCYEDPFSICVYDRLSHIAYLACHQEACAAVAVASVPSDASILVAHDLMSDQAIKERFQATYSMECYHTMYTGKLPPKCKVPSGYTMKLLDDSYLPEIMELYSMEDCNSEEYLLPCIQDGMVGIFDQAILCGFMGVHEESSMGLLEIKPSYRHQGLAIALIQEVTRMQMERGRYPYGEIVKDNIASIHLQKKAGLEVSKEVTYWYFL